MALQRHTDGLAGAAPSRAAWLDRLQEVLAGLPGWQHPLLAMQTGTGSLASTAASGSRSAAQAEGRAAPVTHRPTTARLAPPPDERKVDLALRASCDWLLAQQAADGHWVAELEADTTLESYFILFKAFFGQRDHPKVARYAQVLRETMLPGGGWAIYAHGPAEISVSVLSYFALKVAGVPADEPDMVRSRDVILALGGVPKANTYTKFYLAFFDQYSWEHVPAIPPEMIFIPALAPINIYEMSSWSRTIFVPLSIIYALRPVCPLPPECQIDELFPGGREHSHVGQPDWDRPFSWANFFLLTDTALKIAQKLPIQAARQAAIKRAEQWMIERFEASGGLGAILPAMMNSVIALRILGHKDDDPLVVEGLRQLDALEIQDPNDGGIRIQPCHSAVWDCSIAVYALAQAGEDPDSPALRDAVQWLLAKEVKRRGDWAIKNPAPPGGWYFEYENEFYPDVDDTIMVMMALRLSNAPGYLEPVDAAIERGLTWVLGMQCSDGGWASFDRDNSKEFLTKIPFADHNAMIDPSTADITGRTLEMFGILAPEVYSLSHPVVVRALEFLKRDQCQDGSWFGRWGVNYMYGTWQVLRGLRLIGEDMSKGYVRKAVEWFRSTQLEDGGWGERCDTYEDPSRKGLGPSTPSQTAWAVMGLLAAGQGASQSVRRGVHYLLTRQRADGTWDEDEWTGTGFPRVFYLKYHYYRHYWPLMALAQYRRFVRGYRP